MKLLMVRPGVKYLTRLFLTDGKLTDPAGAETINVLLKIKTNPACFLCPPHPAPRPQLTLPPLCVCVVWYTLNLENMYI